MPARVKICGINGMAALGAAVDAGAAYVGLVFHPASPRHLPLGAARALSLGTPAGVARVALTVDADDATLDAILAEVPVDILQLHGGESPGRVASVRARFGLPVMKAVGIADAGDLAAIDAHATAADILLVDARPPRGAPPGGNGMAFDWGLIAGRRWSVPWLLAGGLTPQNVAGALSATGAREVDVSSGVESAPGMKDTGRIAAFCRAAGALPRAPDRPMAVAAGD
jgi:phosphoribosylanthranilate isomerase